MILFEALSIYYVENGQVGLRSADITPANASQLTTIPEAKRPLLVQGIYAGDFAVFISLADSDGVAEIPYLVTTEGSDTSTIVPSDIVELDTRTFGTYELARKLQSVDPTDIAQFGIEALISSLSKRYPPRRP